MALAVTLASPARAAGPVEDARAALVEMHPDGARLEKWAPPVDLTERAQILSMLAALGDPSTRLLDAEQWRGGSKVSDTFEGPNGLELLGLFGLIPAWHRHMNMP